MTSCNCNIQIFLKNFTEVGLKYFILGPFFYEILFIGCCMIYVFIGITNFKELTKIFTGYKILLLGVQSSGIFMEIYLLL
jgi:NADH:ubiquinone oxidoreductase subunit 2 (subunit N)